MRNKNNHMPDVLDCLANLSNDEVFTPPDVANKMLDMLPPEVFASKTTTFLDPFTKSGVFLREITKRLLRNQIPNYESMASEIETIERTAIQDAVRNDELKLTDPEYGDKARSIGRNAIASHERATEFYLFEKILQRELNRILTTQVFGIAITELTAHLTRRSLYCSKNAAGEYSICDGFGVDNEGNIRFEPMRHTWDKGGNCIWCGASKNTLDRPDEYEQHAYEFIHKDIEELRKEYNDTMFENLVICGNPPYQLSDGGGFGDSSTPIYNKFIESAIKLRPRYLTMIIPSRWMKGGKGLDNFRTYMMNDTALSKLVDYENASDVFAGVHIDGGVCYFLRDAQHNGPCEYTYCRADGTVNHTVRFLKTDGINTIIRDVNQIEIIKKAQSESSFSDIVSVLRPYGLRTYLFNEPERYPLADLSNEPKDNYLRVYGVRGKKGGAKRVTGYMCIDGVERGHKNIARYKLFFSKAYSSDCTTPPEIILGMPNDICTETYLEIGGFDTLQEATNCLRYIKTKFFRALLQFNRASFCFAKETFDKIPIQVFIPASDIDWSQPIADIDKQLYAKYGLSEEEIEFIETNIQEMQ